MTSEMEKKSWWTQISKTGKKKKEKDIENYIFDLQTNLNSQFTFSPKGDSCPRQLHWCPR